MAAYRQHLGGYLTILCGIISQAGHHPGLIMITPEQAVPGLFVQPCLPPGQNLLQLGKLTLSVRPLISVFVKIQIHMLELEYHVQLFSVQRRIFQRFFQRHAGAFSHGQRIPAVQDLPAHLLKELMHPRPVGAEIKGRIAVQPRRSVRIRRILGYQADNIHAEPVHTLVQPPVHHPVYFPAHRLIFPVQIRLLHRKKMKIIFPAFFILFPGGATEAGTPVIRRAALHRILPDIIIPVRILFSLSALHEPGMLIRGMVHHQIHHQLHSTLMYL